MDIDDVFTRYDQMQKARANWEQHWEEIAERVLPRSAEFTGEQEAGTKRTSKLYDATAALALERFSSAVESLLTPRGAKWHTLRATNPLVDRDDNVRLWFDQIESLLFNFRYSPKSNFASQMHECYMSLGAFGTAALFVDERDVRGMTYRAVHLSDIFISEDDNGMIDTVFRRCEMTARQALRMFRDGDLSSDLQKLANERPDERVKLLHAVMPRTDRDPTRRDRRNLPFASGYFEIKTRNLIEEGGKSSIYYESICYWAARNLWQKPSHDYFARHPND